MEQTISRVPMQQVEPLGASMSLRRHDVVVGWNPKTPRFARTFCSVNHITLTNYLLVEAFIASSFT